MHEWKFCPGCGQPLPQALLLTETTRRSYNKLTRLSVVYEIDHPKPAAEDTDWSAICSACTIPIPVTVWQDDGDWQVSIG